MLLPGIRRNIFKYWVQRLRHVFNSIEKISNVLYKAGTKLYNITYPFYLHTVQIPLNSGLTNHIRRGGLTFFPLWITYIYSVSLTRHVFTFSDTRYEHKYEQTVHPNFYKGITPFQTLPLSHNSILYHTVTNLFCVFWSKQEWGAGNAKLGEILLLWWE